MSCAGAPGTDMLVIDRRRQQAIVIDRDIRIVLLDTERNRAKFGLETVGTHEILREEQLGAAAPVVTRDPLELILPPGHTPEQRLMVRRLLDSFRARRPR